MVRALGRSGGENRRRGQQLSFEAPHGRGDALGTATQERAAQEHRPAQRLAHVLGTGLHLWRVWGPGLPSVGPWRKQLICPLPSPSPVTLAWENLRASTLATHSYNTHTQTAGHSLQPCFLDWASGRASVGPLHQHIMKDCTTSELGALNLVQISALLCKLRQITSL